MRNDLTDITVVMDRSGSMAAVKSDAENGLNSFIDSQKRQPGSALFSLVQFDTEYEIVHNAVPIQSVPPCTLEPRGFTALLDAVGNTINRTGERLRGMNEQDRPGLVVFVIITDGQENASREFQKARIKEMIEHQQSVYKWQFTYLGANQDSFGEATGLGLPASSAANYAPLKTAVAFNAAANNVVRMRCAAFTGAEVASCYTDEEIREMSGVK